MVYLGSKNKYTKEIIPIIQKIIDDNEIKTYIEPFVGGANVIDKIKCQYRFGFDKSKSLIGLLIKARDNFEEIPIDGSREWWDKAKAIYRGESDEFMEDWKIGAIQFLASFSNGGFPRGYAKDAKGRHYYQEAYRNLLAQAPLLKDIKFYCMPYELLDFKDMEEPCVIYCDPPYQNTKNYGYAFETKFDYEHYWNWIREISKKHFVICSEQIFPEDFNIIWEKNVKRTAGKDNTFKANEKLGVYSKGLLGKYNLNL